MRNRVMTSMAVLTILAGTGAAFGQTPNTREAPSSGTSTQQSPTAPPRSDSGSSMQQMNRSPPPDSSGAESQPGTKGSRHNAQDTRPDRAKNHQSTEERSKGDRMKNSESGSPRGKDERRGSEMKSDTQRSDTRSHTTTGQAGAGAKLSGEQRSRITTVIREQRVQPETNVNFNISIGTRVPRTVHFHPLPAEIITVYPDWRGYDFFLVRDQIVVVNPRTFEIVAVLEA
ncbi:MAG: DUF1236 domain-containing protein [Afipia sp.]|nr:DUF1236 domain-containing protein [Afipia sp.]